MIRLYLTPVPEQTTDTATDQIGADIQQSGLLETGGTVVKNIATQNVDFRKQGRIQLGPTLSRKVAEELDSLSESSYTSLPLFDATTDSLARKRGYYEIARIDVTPAQEARDDVYQYDLSLTLSGTREDNLRSVATNIETVSTPLATGGDAQLAIPSEAKEPRWYSQTTGAEPATVARTEPAQYGDVDFYDPSATTIDNPTLIYNLPFEFDGPTDVRVYDDKDKAKLQQTASGDEVNAWTHAYHTAYQFDGGPVIDTGRARVRFDSDAGIITAEEWNDTASAFDPVNVTMGDFTLESWSLTKITPPSVTARVTLRDITDDTRRDVLIHARRGRSRVLIRPPEGGTITQSVADVFTNIGSDQTTDPNPTQGLIARDSV